MLKLSSIITGEVTRIKGGKISFMVDGKILVRKYKQVITPNWPVLAVRVNGYDYEIDRGL